MGKYKIPFTIYYDYDIEIEANSLEEAERKFQAYGSVEELEAASTLSGKSESDSNDTFVGDEQVGAITGTGRYEYK